jgi:hypothetical protein
MRDIQQTPAGKPAVPGRRPVKFSARICAIMAVTTVLTFATLETAHQLFFPPQQLFA